MCSTASEPRRRRLSPLSRLHLSLLERAHSAASMTADELDIDDLHVDDEPALDEDV